VACPPAPVAERPAPAPTRTRTVDVVVVGAGPIGAATAWHLARRGLAVLLTERCTAAQVWHADGPPWWTADADVAATGLWREVERTTGAALLQVPGPRVRAVEASAALTAAAIGRGVRLRCSDPVRALTITGDGVRVRTRDCLTTAGRVVLAGAGPRGLAPVLPEPAPAHREGPVITALGARSFAVPLLAAAVAELAL
jgi:glycine/D-amino acid oxidase-like deaminating enzyme